ncbi:hypothetical protein [Alkalicoccobacillus murimartini]|uniref:Uncharacterized protein n=1 Tax=Alkalicoccobacillus murimartini TaxID=171685 RepID=A0ABT9YH30_9BACI|nr:hypothetical protein [Alkalicoccobacillus murimartini]MDQ0207171.1 hypothetical protein [Alkalicoccobacillus murimartini]
MLKRISIISTVLILLAGVAIAYIGFSERGSLFSSDRSQQEKEVSTRELGTKTDAAEGIIDYEVSDKRIAFQEGEEETVKELFKKQHDYLNSLAGWGGVERLDHSELSEKEKWRELKKDVQWLKEHGLAPSEAVNDLKNAEALINVSEEHTNEMSVRYLHRIFHDIDAELNDTDVDKIWNVTYAYGSEEEINKVYQYISELRSNEE